MLDLQAAGSGPLADYCPSSHICHGQPCTPLQRSNSLLLHARRLSSVHSPALQGHISRRSLSSTSCLELQTCSGSAQARHLLCRAASQPLPSKPAIASRVSSPYGLRRSSSHSRLDSARSSTLAEPPIAEEAGNAVFYPDIIPPHEKDLDEEWHIFKRRIDSVKVVTDLTAGLQQAMEEIGAMGDLGFSEQDQEMLNSQRAKHESEQKTIAEERERRRIANRARRAAKHEAGMRGQSSELAVASDGIEVSSLSHIYVADTDSTGTSYTASAASLAEAHAPSRSLFHKAPLQREVVFSTNSATRRRQQKVSAAHTTAARRSGSSVQRGLRSRAQASGKSEPVKEKAKMRSPQTVFPVPDNFGRVGTFHKLLSADEEKQLSYQVQAIIPYEEKFEELHKAKLLAAGIKDESGGDSKSNAMHPEEQSGKHEPSLREWAEACDRGSDIPAFEREIADGHEARLQMMECNQRLVRSVAKHFRNRGVACEDLIMEGMLGLRRGIDKFDPAKGFKFSTYAHWWIRQAISRCICDQGRVLKVPYHICDLIARIRKIEREMRAEGVQPRPRLVAEKMGISIPRYHEILAADMNLHSLEQPAGGDGDNRTLEETLEDSGPSMTELVEHGGLVSDVNNLLHTLTPREQGVLRLRYGLDGQGERTLDDIGRFFSVTRERVRQVETKALLKLRQPARSETLLEYTQTTPPQLTWGPAGALGKKQA